MYIQISFTVNSDTIDLWYMSICWYAISWDNIQTCLSTNAPFQKKETKTLGILRAIAWIWFSTRKFWGEDGGAHTALQAFAL